MRVVVNNSTFSIFETFDYEKMAATIDLKYIGIDNGEDHDCILVYDKTNRKNTHTICAM